MKRIQLFHSSQIDEAASIVKQLSFEVLWLSVSPTLRVFDQPLLNYLAPRIQIAQWEYHQDCDEASSLQTTVVLLHDFLKKLDRPVHLAGHGLGGALALLYARQYANRVRSLAMLSVGTQPATTWHAHYYVQRHLLSALSQAQLLAHLSRGLFGNFASYPVKALVGALERDLELSPHGHSLFQLSCLPQGGVAMPMLVCGSHTDPIVSASALSDWQACLKPGDSLWECPDGRHFFHFAYPKLTGDKLLGFWQQPIQQRLLLKAGDPSLSDRSPSR